MKSVNARTFIPIVCLLLFTSKVPSATPQVAKGLPKTSQTFGVLAKKGEHLSFLRASIIPYVVQWSFVFTINRSLGKDIRGSSFKRWLHNVSRLPRVPDGDHWVTNFIGHPLMGASFYTFYREQGFSKKESVAGTFLQSTLFEYTVEAWKKPPSGVDLVVTPLVGSVIGSHIGVNSFILASSYAISKYIFRLF